MKPDYYARLTQAYMILHGLWKEGHGEPEAPTRTHILIHTALDILDRAKTYYGTEEAEKRRQLS